MLEIFNNKEAFLKIKPKNLLIITILILIVIVSLIIVSIKVEIYDNYQTKGYVTCSDKCFLITMIPSNIDYDVVYFNDKKIDYKLINKDLKVDENNFISYYELEFLVNEFEDKEIVAINFYYHKQRIINKIKEKMF